MKISSKEKNLLIAFAVLALMCLYYQFVFSSQMEKVRQMEGKKQEVKAKYDTTMAAIKSTAARETEYKTLNSKIAGKTERFLPAIVQEKIILTLDDMLKKTGLKGSSLAFTPGKADADKNKSILQKETMSVKISFTGTYETIKSFISTLENFSKRTVITDVAMAGGKGPDLSGSTNLEFYAVPAVAIDKEYLQWDYNNKYGKDNPFIGIDGKFISADATTSTTSTQGSSSKTESKDDFFMTVKPISSEFPTIMLGKAKDVQNSTYVYADNAKEEPIEIYFTKADGKYYCKYKTAKDSFPKAFASSAGVQFIPQEDHINLKIYSTKRNSPTDEAGANIKIMNTTDKKVNVVVEREDTARPRVKVAGDGISLEVKTE